jgi:hypothetical protein
LTQDISGGKFGYVRVPAGKYREIFLPLPRPSRDFSTMARAKQSKAKDSKSKQTVSLTPSAQDECLRNSDLLDQIFRFVPPSSESGEADMNAARKTLYSAALISRTFSYSTLKVLWHRLDNLLPLLRLLSTFKRSGSFYVRFASNFPEHFEIVIPGPTRCRR